VLFPFGVVVPIASVIITNSSEGFNTYVQVTIVFGMVVIMMGVTCVTIFFQILLNVELYINIIKERGTGEEEEVPHRSYDHCVQGERRASGHKYGWTHRGAVPQA
jgi:uncharacterized membrane protein